MESIRAGGEERGRYGNMSTGGTLRTNDLCLFCLQLVTVVFSGQISFQFVNRHDL